MKLKELRKENKKTQQEVADYLNIAQATYGRYETDSITPPIETLCKLADFYGVSLDFLVNREYANEFGYMSSEEKLLVSSFRKLSTYNQGKIIGEVAGMLMLQQ